MASGTKDIVAEALVDQMHAIRRQTRTHVAELHQEAHRLVDWREHVRAQPWLAMGATALVGFTLRRGLFRSTKLETTSVEPKLASALGVMPVVTSLL